MSNPRPIRLKERASGQLVDGVVRVATLADKLLWTKWRDFMPATAEDGAWNWDEFIDSALNDPGQFVCEVVVLAGEIQGMMLVGISGAETAEFGLYVAHLATAPWNRPPESKFRGVGSVLLSHAVIRSELLGHHGRIYLESKPKAEAYYQRIGMTIFGTDPEGFVKFQFKSEQALDFLVKYQSEGDKNA